MNKYHNLRLYKKEILFTIVFLGIMHYSFAQFQTQTAISNPVPAVSADILGYYESLPGNYGDTTKKFPLIIFLHASQDTGNGTTELSRVLSKGLPKVINDNQFPNAFTVNGTQSSFIVISPQIKRTTANMRTVIKSIIDYSISNYRVDTTRIYLTGSRLGGNISWIFAGYDQSNANRLAAILLVSPNLGPPVLTSYATNTAASNLPMWTLGNYNDPVILHSRLELWRDTVNLFNPDPLAKLTFFYPGTPSDDSWTTAYNPDSSWGGLNIYQWMLQYTNNKLTANAGQDRNITLPQDTVITVDGSKSMARQGRIASYLWAKLTGPSGSTITIPSNAATTIRIPNAGTYTFELKVTHTDSSIARDTILVNAQNSSPASKKGVNILERIYNIAPMQMQNVIVVNSDTTDMGLRPAIFFIPGSGEVGTDTAKLSVHGPLHFLNQGWQGTITINGKTYNPYWFFIQPYGASETPVYNTRIIDSIKTRYASVIDTNRVYLTGLSLGANVIVRALCEGYHDYAAAVVPMSIAISSVPARDSSRIQTYALTGGGFYGLTGVNDYNNSARTVTPQFVNAMNTHRPGSGQFYGWTHGGGLHSEWNVEYDPETRRISGENIYEWMLQYTKERLSANAGHDRALIVPGDSTILDGSKSSARQGSITSYSWTKLSGPSGGTITTASDPITSVTGLTEGVYTFELEVTHSDGITIKKDTAIVTVAAASPRKKAVEEIKVASGKASDSQLLDVKLNPNPVHSNLTVWITGEAKGRSSLTLYTLQGQRLSQQVFNKENENPVSRTVRTSNLPAGYYSILVTIGRHQKVINFIKQ